MILSQSLPSRLLTFALTAFLSGGAVAQQVQYSTQHRNAERGLPQSVTGSAALRAQLQADRHGISLAVGDLDSDGVPDLITGYATGAAGALTVQRGFAGAIAPGPNEMPAIQRGEWVAPFLAKAASVALPVRPDFLHVADVNGDGALDVVVAARGGGSIYVLSGDGRGHLGEPREISAGGTISAVSMWRTSGGGTAIVAGVCAAQACRLQILQADGTVRAGIALPAAATAIEIGNWDRGSIDDVAVIAGGRVLLIEGDSLLSGNPAVEALPVGGTAAALAAGNFVYDKRGYGQIAVLGTDATLHVFARAGVDNTGLTHAEVLANRSRVSLEPVAVPKITGMAWTEVETLASVGPTVGDGAAPLLLRAHLSAGGGDDLAVMAAGQFVQVSHPVTVSAADPALRESRAVITLDSTSSVVAAAAPARVSPDSRFGVLTADGSAQPFIAVPPTNKTYNVNTTVDTAVTPAGQALCTNNLPGCNLRNAISLVNQDAAANGLTKVDVVNIAAGTYTFNATVYAPGLDSTGSVGYHYDVDGSVNILGAGASTTILDAKTLDKIFSVDSGVNGPYAPLLVFMSGLTLQNGTNNNNPAVHGASNNFGGLLDWESDGTGYLTLNSVVLTNGTAMWGPGGAIGATNSSAGPGTLEIDNSTISNNSSPVIGGGLALGFNTPLTLNLVVMNQNTASTSINAASTQKIGQGGGVYANSNSTTAHSSITGGSFTGNTASDAGGGIFSLTGITISGTTFTSNTAGTFGGGLFFNTIAETGTITSATFLSNSAPTDGGAIFVGTSNTGNILNMHYSRIHSNTSSNGHSGIAVGIAGNTGGTVDASKNWWGCNGPATGTNCDTGAALSGSLTLLPYTALTMTLSGTLTPATTPPSIRYGQFLTATGDMAHDSTGAALGSGNLAAYVGLPAVTRITQSDGSGGSTSGTLSTVTASQSYGQTMTVPGLGTASITVDGFASSVAFKVTAPDLTVTSTHTGNFHPGDVGDTYTITPTNSGDAPTTANVTVVDTLPSVFTATAIAGPGWSCDLPTLTCTRTNSADVFAAATSLPAITLTVNVAAGAANAGTFSNSAAVSGGGEPPANTGNNTGTDPTLVIAPPAMSAAFAPPSVPVNGSSTLTFTLSNPATNPVTLTGIGFTVTLPAGLTVASTPNTTTNCTGATTTAAGGGTSISFSGGSLASGSTCTFSLSVTGVTAGSYTVTGSTISSANGGPGGPAIATLSVLTAPTISTSFSPTSIPLNTNSTLSYTVTNPNTANSLAGVGFTDSLPAGLVVAAVNGVSGSCGSGTITATPGSSTISLSGGTLPSSGTCTFSVNVTGSTAGAKVNSVTPSATVAGSGPASTATLTVVAPPTAFIAFGAATIPLNGSTTLTFTLTNPNAVSLSGVNLTDSLPAGLVVATPNGSTGSCGTGTISATAGGGSITLTGGTIAGNATCTFAVNVTGTTAGAKANTTAAVSSTEGGTGTTSNTATLTVVAPPVLTAALAGPTVALNGTTSLTFNVTNNNPSTALTGVAFTVTLPAGLVVSTPSGISNTCGGTASASGNSITLSSGSVNAGATCALSVNVTATSAGAKTVATSTVSSTNGGVGNSTTASVTVVAPPSILGTFGAANIQLNATTSLSFTITNPNSSNALSGVAFTDSLPAGLVVANPNGASGACGSGVITATSGSGSISLSGGTIAANGSCTFSVNVQGTTSGSKLNSETVTSVEGGTGNTSTQSVTVALGASKLVYGTVPPSPITAGANAGTITVYEEDSNSAVTTGANDAVTLAVTAATGYSQTYTVTAVNGVATFNLSSVPLTIAATYTYTATSGTLTLAQVTESVVAGTATGLSVTGFPSPAQTGAPGTVTVRAVDSFGNTATSFSGTVTLTSSDPLAVLPAPYTYVAGDAGVHTFSVTLNTATPQSITATSGALTGTQAAITVLDSIWIVNADGTLARLTDTGTPTSNVGPSRTPGTLAALAFDNLGNVWSTSTSGVIEFSRTGSNVGFAANGTGGLNSPVGLAIDGVGQVWTVNSNNTVSVLNPAATPVTPGTGYQGGNINTPTAIMIDGSGSVWITNSGNSSVTKIIGGAAPVVTPTVLGTAGNTLGTRP